MNWSTMIYLWSLLPLVSSFDHCTDSASGSHRFFCLISVVFFSYLDECLEQSRPYNQTEVNARYFAQVEEPFTFSQADYPHVPTGG